MSHFPLFRLPGELRDEIYKYALMETERFSFLLNGPGLVLGRESSNQLQFVNRALYKETNGLEFKFNKTLIFCSQCDREKHPGIQFAMFLRRIPASKLWWTKTIYLITEYNFSRPVVESEPTVTRVGALCRELPHIQVNYVLSYVSRIVEDPTTYPNSPFWRPRHWVDEMIGDLRRTFLQTLRHATKLEVENLGVELAEIEIFKHSPYRVAWIGNSFFLASSVLHDRLVIKGSQYVY